MTISGANLGLDTDDVSVDVGGSPCTIVSLSVGADTLTCTTTVHAPAASASIVVTTVSGGSSSQPFTFAYRTTPSIASVNPTVGPTAGGARITGLEGLRDFVTWCLCGCQWRENLLSDLFFFSIPHFIPLQ